MELSKFCEIMGVIMQQGNKQEKAEIIVKGKRLEDHPKVGPKIGIVDRAGVWYNSLRSKWTKIPGAWEALSALVAGDRVDLTWEVVPYPANDGTQKYRNDILGFDKIIQVGDEVKPVPPADLPGETLAQMSPPLTVTRQAQDLMPKMSCLRAAAEVVTALIGAGQVPDNPTEEVCLKARALYLDLTGNW